MQTFHIQYGPSENRSHSAETDSIEDTGPGKIVWCIVTGLQPSTEYHLKIIATNRMGSKESGVVEASTLGDTRLTNLLSMP